jgi:glycosyltransferase involved in cell wall biosynthesis
MKKRIVILTSHPIQYNAPFFVSLTQEFELTVLYTLGVDYKLYDKGFKSSVVWDVDLLKNYRYRFIRNISPNKTSKSFWGSVSPGLTRAIIKEKPSAVIIYGWHFFSHLIVMLRLKGRIPVFFRGDSIMLDRRRSYLKDIILRFIYELPDIFLTVGSENSKYFSHYKASEDKFVLMPHAVDIDRFRKAVDINNQKALRNTFSIYENDYTFLFAGKFEQKKNVSLLISAFQQMKNPNTKLLLIGTGELMSQLKSEAKGNQNVIFAGFVNQSSLPDYYALCNCVILPSRGPNETWGLVINEAIALHKPVIVSNKCGCAADIVESGKNGYVFSSENMDSLLKCMLEIMGQNEETVVSACEKINEEYSYEVCTSVLKSIV